MIINDTITPRLVLMVVEHTVTNASRLDDYKRRIHDLKSAISEHAGEDTAHLVSLSSELGVEALRCSLGDPHQVLERTLEVQRIAERIRTGSRVVALWSWGANSLVCEDGFELTQARLDHIELLVGEWLEANVEDGRVPTNRALA